MRVLPTAGVRKGKVMNDKDFGNLGHELYNLKKELEQTTRNIISSRNPSELRRTLNNTVWNVVDTVKKSAQAQTPPHQPGANPPGPAPGGNGIPTPPPRQQQNRTYSYQSAYQPPQRPQPSSSSRLPVPGFFAPIGLLVLGGVMFFLSLIALLVAALFSAGAAALIGCLIPALAGGILIGTAIRKFSFRSRVQKYNRAIGTASFVSIKQLADSVSKPQELTLKDCRRLCREMSSLHLDKEETCLILDRETYQFYLEAQNSQRRREAEEEKRRQEAERDPKRAQLYETLKEGNQYLRKIREVNHALPGEEISRKLSRLELVTEKIFLQVEQQPECLPDIRRFMNYYLPTTLKLVTAYQKFEEQPVQGSNIIEAKKEILDALDTAGIAFENLLNKLFQDDAMDISTDISAMETILSQEGLLDNQPRS